MRVLTMTTLYPNGAAPSHGVFVENRLRAFADRSGAEIRVVAPTPWFPLAADWAGRYAAYARAPKLETRRGLEVRHPRYVIAPKIAMTYAAHALEQCFFRAARALRDEGFDFDLIDAHYLYPDGVAAARVARRLNKPVVLTARGSDATRLPAYPRPRAMIVEALGAADAVIAVSGALKDALVELGASADKIRVLRNGVDLDRFKPLDRTAIRARLGLRGPVIASVGHLIERKGHHLVIEALTALPEATLLIAGAGKEARVLKKLAARLGVGERARFLGALAHEKLAEIYNAADALVLASSREGWPNVLLEAMACGAPVVAAPFAGADEIIASPKAGLIAGERSAPAIAEAVSELLAAPPSRHATRQYAEGFSWDETSDTLTDLFEGVIAAKAPRRAAQGLPTP